MAVPKVGREDSSENLRQRFLLSSNIVMLSVNYLISAYEKLKANYNSFINSDHGRYSGYFLNSYAVSIISFIFIAFIASSMTNLSGNATPPLIVGVLSSRGNFMERLTLRNTWAMDLLSLNRETRLVFILGDTDCPIHPEMRLDKSSCKPSHYIEDKPLFWNNVEWYHAKEKNLCSDSCVQGFGLKVIDDVTVSIDPTEKLKGKYFLRFADSQMELIDDIFLPKGAEVEVIMTSNEDTCAKYINKQSCQWRNGNSLEYTFVRFADGSIEPFSQQKFCTPFNVKFNRADQSLCLEGWKYHNGNCYYYYSGYLYNEIAEEFCNKTDSFLVSILNSQENEFVNGLRGDRSIWLGLKKINQNWRWSDNNNLTYSNWDDFEPNSWDSHEFCSEMRSNSKWNDVKCYKHKSFVCKRRADIPVKSRQQEGVEEKWLRHLKNIDERVREESNAYGDIVIVNDLQDTYSSLPNKLKGLIKWTHQNHPGAWLFKTDDDTYVNILKLDDIMSSYSKTSSVKGTFFTTYHSSPAIFSHFTKLRSVPYFGKNAEYGYNSLTYPPFPAGAGYLMTDSVVEGLSELLPSLHSLQGEDVSLGLWLSSLTFKKLHPNVDSLNYQKVLEYGTNILKGLFEPLLAKVTNGRYQDTVSLPQDEMYQPQLIEIPCWVGKKGECMGGVVVKSEQSINDLVENFNARI